MEVLETLGVQPRGISYWGECPLGCLYVALPSSVCDKVSQCSLLCASHCMLTHTSGLWQWDQNQPAMDANLWNSEHKWIFPPFKLIIWGIGHCWHKRVTFKHRHKYYGVGLKTIGNQCSPRKGNRKTSYILNLSSKKKIRRSVCLGHIEQDRRVPSWISEGLRSCWGGLRQEGNRSSFVL